MKVKIVLFLIVGLVVSGIIFQFLASKQTKTENSNWRSHRAPIYLVLDDSGRSIIMPQLVIYNDKGQLISQIKRLKNVEAFDAEQLVNREIPFSDDFEYLNRIIPAQFNSQSFNAYLIFPDPNSLPMDESISIENILSLIEVGLTKKFKNRPINFNVTYIYQG